MELPKHQNVNSTGNTEKARELNLELSVVVTSVFQIAGDILWLILLRSESLVMVILMWPQSIPTQQTARQEGGRIRWGSI